MLKNYRCEINNQENNLGKAYSLWPKSAFSLGKPIAEG